LKYIKEDFIRSSGEIYCHKKIEKGRKKEKRAKRELRE
jgi:hypothetical protein